MQIMRAKLTKRGVNWYSGWITPTSDASRAYCVPLTLLCNYNNNTTIYIYAYILIDYSRLAILSRRYAKRGAPRRMIISSPICFLGDGLVRVLTTVSNISKEIPHANRQWSFERQFSSIFLCSFNGTHDNWLSFSGFSLFAEKHRKNPSPFAALQRFSVDYCTVLDSPVFFCKIKHTMAKELSLDIRRYSRALSHSRKKKKLLSLDFSSVEIDEIRTNESTSSPPIFTEMYLPNARATRRSHSKNCSYF